MAAKKLLYPNLLAEMARHDVSVSELAGYMGMSAANLYYKFRGQVTFNERDMKAIQEYLSGKGGGACTIDYLFKSEE